MKFKTMDTSHMLYRTLNKDSIYHSHSYESLSYSKVLHMCKDIYHLVTQSKHHSSVK